MILKIYTIVHTLISLVAIFTGFVVLFGMLSGRRLDIWTKWFLVTAIGTTTKRISVSISRRYAGNNPRNYHRAGAGNHSLSALFETVHQRMEVIYVVGAVMSLYFNLFVLVAQLFQKVPALHAITPTQTEIPLMFTQLAVVIVTGILAIVAGVRFHPESTRPA